MEKDKLIEQMLKEKGDSNNSIDLDAYGRGLIDMYKHLQSQLNNNEVFDLVSLSCSMCGNTDSFDECGGDEFACTDCGHFPITA